MSEWVLVNTFSNIFTMSNELNRDGVKSCLRTIAVDHWSYYTLVIALFGFLVVFDHAGWFGNGVVNFRFWWEYPQKPRSSGPSTIKENWKQDIKRKRDGTWNMFCFCFCFCLFFPRPNERPLVCGLKHSNFNQPASWSLKAPSTLISCLFSDINECLSSPCRNGGTCVDGINRYTCSCRPGYTETFCQSGE